jgi:hypothetical protein
MWRHRPSAAAAVWNSFNQLRQPAKRHKNKVESLIRYSTI